MRNQVTKSIFSIGIIIILAIAGCIGQSDSGGSDSSGEADSKLEKVKYIEVKVYDPVFIADKLGYFEEEGVDIEFVGSAFGGPEAIISVATGKADATIAAIPAIINAVKSGSGIKGVADLQTGFEDSPLQIWFVLNNSNINTAQDLKGKKMGVNTFGASFHYTTLEYLKKNNIDPSEVEFITIPHPNLEQTLRSGQIDVAGMIDPFTAKAEATGGVRRLFTGVDTIGERQFALIFFSNEFLENKPEVARAFLKAYVRAIDFSNQNSDRAFEIISNRTGVDKKFITKHLYTENGKVNEDDVKFWIDLMVEKGDLEEGVISVEDVATNEFNPFLSS